MAKKKNKSARKATTKPKTKKAPARTVSEEVDCSKPLKNSKYERFCQQYIVDNNGTQAAIRAKYSEKTAGSKAVSLLQIVVIKNRIAYLQLELSVTTGVSAKSVVAGFRKIAFGVLSKNLTNKHKLRALENLAKQLGLYSKDNAQRQGLTLADIAALAGVTHGGS